MVYTPKLHDGRKRVKINATINPELWAWVSSQIGPTNRWYSPSHAIEMALDAMRTGDDAFREMARLKVELNKCHGALELSQSVLAERAKAARATGGSVNKTARGLQGADGSTGHEGSDRSERGLLRVN